MCGIAGFLDLRKMRSATASEKIGRAMAHAIRHRGPDDADTWTDAAAGLTLAHRRLSIIDLSSGGRQPMVSANGRWVIAYNGEVYNFRELRRDLQQSGQAFRGNSDTEVVLEACAAWGLEATLQRLIGMFAFALWDRSEQVVYLARDRLGIKPLYWGHHGDVFMFGSELKALKAQPDWRPEVDRDSLTTYMRYGYVPSPMSIYKGISKLPPGSLLRFRPGGTAQISCYWDIRSIARDGVQERSALSDADAICQVEALLRDAVKRRLVSDVPLGAFLSGGIDSSCVAALMRDESAGPIRTFSIGFNEDGFDEAPHAKAVARHLGTDHTEHYVTPADALAVVPTLPDMFDEPFADSSQIPTYLVSAMTRRHVTVALSGDGGDELFGGYTRYVWGVAWWRRIGAVPLTGRKFVGDIIEGVPESTWNHVFRAIPRRFRPPTPGRKMHVLSNVLRIDNPDALYRRQHTHWHQPEEIVLGGRQRYGALHDPSIADDIPNFAERMQLFDILTYLHDDILTKVDRASMAVSLEARVPILDHRVVEFAWRLPKHMKIREGRGKWLLRQVLKRYVPEALTDRPKMGFGVPIEAWLRGPLRDWAETLLDEQRLAREGYFNPAPIRQCWTDFITERTSSGYRLWTVLMFQAWLERQTSAKPHLSQLSRAS